MPNRHIAILLAAASIFAFAAMVVAVVVVAVMPARAADDVAAKALACASCHGQNGTPISATFPIIWGQQQNYLYKELHDFHSGDRKNPIMAPLVQTLSLDDLRAMAIYFSDKTWPAKQVASTAAAAHSAAAARRHRRQNPGLQSLPPGEFRRRRAGAAARGLKLRIPRLRHARFANGQRTNNLDMPGFMKALTDSERDAMAHYLAGL